MSSTTVIIAGMHRSGTSLTASLLKDAGVDIGDDLLPPAPDNQRGFFEDRGFQEFHEQVMAKGGTIICLFLGTGLPSTMRRRKMPGH
ncbi:hypothetical protein HML84_06000 [Alcanivorax sp. IO_7]|nr:hypothetical protein HML84_06000 [Alcanivorax sp. IO_7]